MPIIDVFQKHEKSRSDIRDKLIAMGLATNTDQLEQLAEAIVAIVNHGSVNASVNEGQTYTLQPGYYKGGAIVALSIDESGKYQLQDAGALSPTEKEQVVTPGDGYYGLSKVTILPIPQNYKSVTPVTADAADVLAGKVIVTLAGPVPGEMLNQGAVNYTISIANPTYNVPKGFHNGNGEVKIIVQSLDPITPTKQGQTLNPDGGKVFGRLVVNPIPEEYQDVSEVTASAADVLKGKYIVLADGSKVEGAILIYEHPNTITLDAANTNMAIEQGYHAGTHVYTNVQYRTVTPNEDTQQIKGDNNAFLGSVVVNPIPSEYQDVSGVDAVASDVLQGKHFVDKYGVRTEGSINNYGPLNGRIDGLTKTSITIPKGYTTGGEVELTDDIENLLKTL